MLVSAQTIAYLPLLRHSLGKPTIAGLVSQLLIQQYLNQLASLKKVSGTSRESVVREAFKDLLKGWARSHDLVFVPEYEIETKARIASTGAGTQLRAHTSSTWPSRAAKQ